MNFADDGAAVEAGVLGSHSVFHRPHILKIAKEEKMIESRLVVRAMREREEEDGRRDERWLVAGCMAFLSAMVLLMVFLAVSAFDAEWDAHEEFLREYRAGVEANNKRLGTDETPQEFVVTAVDFVMKEIRNNAVRVHLKGEK